MSKRKLSAVPRTAQNHRPSHSSTMLKKMVACAVGARVRPTGEARLHASAACLQRESDDGQRAGVAARRGNYGMRVDIEDRRVASHHVRPRR